MSDVIEEGQKPQAAKKENDFSKGSVISNILKLALPMTLAQLINVLYNVVDRIYIGRIPGAGSLPLDGGGLFVSLPYFHGYGLRQPVWNGRGSPLFH